MAAWASEHSQQSDGTSQQAAADAMQHPWHAQPSHHDQRRSSVELQSKQVAMHTQPALQAHAVNHTAYSGWQEHGVSERQHHPSVPVDTTCDNTGSNGAQGAGDMQDVNMRLQQVLAMCIYRMATWCTVRCLASHQQVEWNVLLHLVSVDW